MKIIAYRFAPYSRTLGVYYSRELLGQWHHCVGLSLWFFCVYVEVKR